jgi:Anti-sigma-K factor rskA.
MNIRGHDIARDDFPDALRWQLRALRRDVEPRRELWDGIAARIAATPQVGPAPSATPRRPHRGLSFLAAAAVLALAVALGWRLHPEAVPRPAPAREAPLLVAADAMTREYEGALREIEAILGTGTAPAPLSELDASAAEVRAALARSPDSLFLFDRLQRIYAQRLALTLRLAAA